MKAALELFGIAIHSAVFVARFPDFHVQILWFRFWLVENHNFELRRV